jgi:peptidoglycan/LPS O-acetylase OafA/YrhL
MTNRNIYSIDAMRAFAIIAVILIHMDALTPGADAGPLYLLFRTTWRIAVPFFFATSAYLLANKILREQNTPPPLANNFKRILTLFLLWSLFHFINLPNLTATINESVSLQQVYWSLAAHYQRALDVALQDWPKFILSGGIYHLWFLPALIFGMAAVALSLKLDFARLLLPVSILVYLVDTLVLDNWQVNYAISLLSCAIGLQIRLAKPDRPNLAYSLLLIGAIYNIFMIMVIHSSDMNSNIAYGPGSLLLAAALLIYCIAKPDFGKGTWLPRWGQYTMGIYVIHPLFDQYYSALPYWQGTVGLIGLACAIYLTSLSVVYLLSHLSLTRKLVM